MTSDTNRKTARRLKQFAAVVAAAALAACASSGQKQADVLSGAVTPVQTNAAGLAEARADSARNPYTMADIHFMYAMIGHHSQAATIAAWAPSHGANASVRRLAERIVNGQKDEIVIMQQWLSDRRQPVPRAGATAMKMTMDGMDHSMDHASMPGMLSQAQLKQLDDARGPEFDRLFLTYMIQHHRGAVSMVKDLFGTYGAGQDATVFKFASDVNVDQATEIDRMQKMLVSLTLGVPFP
ncbi:MAG: DUF305 domain-containing protein [Gemmatimonadaceae bacterium]